MLDREEANRDYTTAFREAGIDVDQLPPAEAGARIAARPGARELTAALGQWIFERQNLSPPDQAGARRLLAVANAADPDPWRCRLREVVINGDGDMLRQFADTIIPLAVPFESVQRLAEALRRVAHDPGRAVKVLRVVQRRHSNDFWLNWDLGAALGETGPEGAREGLQFFAAAVAIRPESGFARTFLARRLGELGYRDEAIAQFQEAVRLAPDSATPRFVLAEQLVNWGKGDRAIEEFADAIGAGLAPSKCPWI